MDKGKSHDAADKRTRHRKLTPINMEIDMENNSSGPGIEAALTTLIDEYNELNISTIDELSEEPSPLEFMRYVAKNRPFVVRGAAKNWKACKRWNVEYLAAVMGNSPVKVAMTPKG
jgi:hypothetical protein